MWRKIHLLANKEHLTILYKLLNDLLFIALAFFLASLIAEGVVPGIIISHIGFSKIVLFIMLNLSAIYITANYADIKIENDVINKKIAILLLLLALLLVFNSLFKINIFLNLFILFFSAVIGYYLYKIILEESV